MLNNRLTQRTKSAVLSTMSRCFEPNNYWKCSNPVYGRWWVFLIEFEDTCLVINVTINLVCLPFSWGVALVNVKLQRFKISIPYTGRQELWRKVHLEIFVNRTPNHHGKCYLKLRKRDPNIAKKLQYLNLSKSSVCEKEKNVIKSLMDKCGTLKIIEELLSLTWPIL